MFLYDIITFVLNISELLFIMKEQINTRGKSNRTFTKKPQLKINPHYDLLGEFKRIYCVLSLL